MGSVWTHAICHECWNRRNPDKRIPVVRGRELCCFCNRARATGITVRENPVHLACKGQHDGARVALPDPEPEPDPPAEPDAAVLSENSIGTGCAHEPADPEAFAGTLCWHCGALMHYAGQRWRILHHFYSRAG